MKNIFFIILFSASLVSAHGKEHGKDHKHEESKAHVHGAGSLSMAFDGPRGEIEFEIPTESLYGFEYAPKTAADKKKQSEALAKLENQISDIVTFAPDRECKISKYNIEVNQEKNHSDVDASFKVECKSALEGSSITINAQKVFPKISNLKVQVIVGDIQKSADAKANGTTIEIKK